MQSDTWVEYNTDQMIVLLSIWTELEEVHDGNEEKISNY